MADRSVIVRLAVEANRYKADMAAAGQAAAQAANQATSAWKKPQSEFGKTARAIQQNEGALKDVGGTLVGLGTSMAGLTTATLGVGVGFNNLKQTSTAAMTTLTGSTARANAQMDKLNKFGSEDSWVMRDVLLRAQQQMAGFGIETEKIIPYMDGLQEAVAATGGSSQDFEELATVMSKVKSQGKITAETFNEFGSRGVDAATIIGESMGKTGDEIRQSVTDGTLGADEALDALADGMKNKFDGASENVKQTFRGAVDNVLAGWRDLSSELASPIVDPSGGGLGVDGLNLLADGLYKAKDAAEALPTPVKVGASALGVLGGGATVAAGGFFLMAPRIVDTIESVKQLSNTMPRTTSAMTKIGKAAGLLAGSFVAAQLAGAAFNAMLDTGSRSAEEMTNKIVQLRKGAEGDVENTVLDPKIWEEANGFWAKGIGTEGIETWGDAFDRAGDKASKWLDSFINTRSDATIAQETIDETDRALTDLATNGAYEDVARGFKAIADQSEDMTPAEVLDRFPVLRDELSATATDLGLAADDATLVALAMGEIKPPTDEAGEGFAGLSAEAQAAQEQLEETRKGLVDGANGFLDFTEKAKDSKTTLREWIDDMEEQVEAQGEWMDNLQKLAERGAPQELLDQLLQMGPEGARMVKKLADGSDEDMQRVIDIFKNSKKNVNDFANSVAGIPTIDLDADPSKLRGQIKDSKKRLTELKNMPTTPTIDAQIKLLEEKIEEAEAKLREVEKEPTKAKVDADTQPAKDEVGGFKKWFKDHSSVTMSVWAKIKETFSSGKKTKQDEHNPNRLHNYHGGILEYYAQGGFKPMDPVAQMVQPNSWRVVGDRADVDEAYVPLDGSARSVKILEEAIARMPGYEGMMASGGIVAAEKRLSAAQRELDAIRNAGRKVTPEDRKQDQAQRRVDNARDALDRAKDAEARKDRINDLRDKLRVDIRRGNIRDQVTGSLSSGQSAIDRLFDLGENEDLSRSSRNRATASARRFESSLTRLYKQAEQIDKKLEKAQDKAKELRGISDSVTNSLMSDRGIDVGDYQNFSGGQWTTHSGVAGATRRMSASVAEMKAFADKLQKLQKQGLPGVLLQEIAQAGVAEGTTMADAFLGATASEQKAYIGAWNEYEQQANRVGEIVTGGFYKGGVNAAEGVVKGLEAKQKNVESAIAKLAKSMESTFKQVLGIRSPARATQVIGEFTAEGFVQGMLGGIGDVQAAASALSGAAMPSVGSMTVDVGMNPVMSGDELTADSMLSDMSGSTLEAMEQMRLSVSEGWAAMLLSMQENQAVMLLGTQETQAGMVEALVSSWVTQRDTQGAALDAMNEKLSTSSDSQVSTHAKAQDSMSSKLKAATDSQKSTQSTSLDTMLSTLTSNMDSQRVVHATAQNSMTTKQRDTLSQQLKQLQDGLSSQHSSMSSILGDMSSTLSTRWDRMRQTQATDLSSMRKNADSGFTAIRDFGSELMSSLARAVGREMGKISPHTDSAMKSTAGVLNKFAGAANKAFSDLGVKVPTMKYDQGGVVPGYSPGRDIHHFRSTTAGDLYLSGGEGILRPEATRMIGGERGIRALNTMARTGNSDAVTHMLGGMAFAGGGVVPPMPGVNAFADSGVWRNLWAMTKKQFPSAVLTSAYRGGSITASGNLSHHARGNAIDVSPSMDIFNWWRKNYGANLAELIYSPANGKQIKNGRNHMYTGAVRSMHFNHVHIAAVKALSEAMAGGLPGMGGEMAHPFLDKAKVKPGTDLEKSYKKAAEKITGKLTGQYSKQLPDNLFGQGLGKGIMEQISGGLIKEAGKYGKKMTYTDPGGSGVERWRDTVIQALKMVGLPTTPDYVNAWLRQIKSESGGNPSIRQGVRDINSGGNEAMGLVQVIPGTFAAYRSKSLPNDRTHPLANLYAGMNYAKHRYPNMLSVIGHGHGYNGGSFGARRGYNVVGENGWELVGKNGPEVRWFDGGETVIPHNESSRMISSSSVGSGGIDYDRLAKAVVNNLPPSLVQHIDPSSLDAKKIGDQAVQAWTDKQNLYAMGAR